MTARIPTIEADLSPEDARTLLYVMAREGLVVGGQGLDGEPEFTGSVAGADLAVAAGEDLAGLYRTTTDPEVRAAANEVLSIMNRSALAFLVRVYQLGYRLTPDGLQTPLLL